MSSYSDDSDFVPSEEDLEDELEEEESDDLNLSDFEKDMSVEVIVMILKKLPVAMYIPV